MSTYEAWPSNGDWWRGLVARNTVAGGWVGKWAMAGGGVTALPGTNFAEAYVKLGVQRPDWGYSVGFFSNGNFIASQGCKAFETCASLGGEAWLDLGGATRFDFGAQCFHQGLCSTAWVATQSTWQAAIELYGLALRVVDHTAPDVRLTGGALASGEWVRGSQAVSFDAVDNSGIRSTSLAVDGATQASGDRSGGCDFAQQRPCSDVGGGSHGFDTRPLKDGAHSFAVHAADASGNGSSSGDRILRVDNTAPAAVVASVEGGDAVRAQNAFTVVWQNAATQAAPIARAHFRLCPAGASVGCQVGSQAGTGISSVRNLTLPTPGGYTVRVWLEDAAGNVGDEKLAKPVTLRYGVAGAGTSISAAAASRLAAQRRCEERRASQARSRRARKPNTRPCPAPSTKPIRLSFGRKAKIAGSLAGQTGPLAGATVKVLAKLTNPGTDWLEEGELQTGPDGSFTYDAPAGPSRRLQFLYPGVGDRAPALAEVVLAVRARSSLRADRRFAFTGQRVRFSGRLAGGPIPPGGKVVDLQAFYRNRWRTFATPRTDANGAWQFRYRFEATRGRVAYRFRARVRHEAAYPYETGYSREARVIVRG